MRVATIGTVCVGRAPGAGFADVGHVVTCTDKDAIHLDLITGHDIADAVTVSMIAGLRAVRHRRRLRPRPYRRSIRRGEHCG
ncbi:hypothetical protein [Brevundimonas balnearis]|uniref:Uncharacterized protein n=1 Tax=Brevundimonas balnearis TaxID=1572858 RepID=A0ABV6QYM6_9CAUL